MAETKATRVSDKQKKENFLDSKLADILTSNESFEAFWDKAKKDNLEADTVLMSLIGLYANGSIKLKKKKIVQEILVMDEEE